MSERMHAEVLLAQVLVRVRDRGSERGSQG